MGETSGRTGRRIQRSLGVVLMVVAVAGAGTPEAGPYVIRKGPSAAHRIALTFDACATRAPSRVDRRVIDILMATGTPATFFLGGKWMKDHSGEARLLGSLPQFELGNHSYLHPHMPLLAGKQIAAELRKTQQTLRAFTGRTARWFRPPYGEWSPAVAESAAAQGLRTVLYDLPSGDPDSNATATKLVEHVVRKARNGSIIVMHVNGRGWHTAEALPEILTRLKARGFEFVTVGQLIDTPATGTQSPRGTSPRP